MRFHFFANALVTDWKNMDCNKDEAARSREIAEQKFLQHDLFGARKFALKAQDLFPELEGLTHFIAVLDVYIVAQDKVNGVEDNWYGILQTNPTADDATIKRQYRKLALILHPDKNRAVGAEGAFKLLSEAWEVLSDKIKRSAHDARRRANSYQSGLTSTKGKGVSGSSNGFYNIPRFDPGKRSQVNPARKSDAFWTACPFCKMQFEYMRMYQNQKLACPTCSEPFSATETPVVSGNDSWHPREQHSSKVNGGFSHHQTKTYHQTKTFANWGRMNSFSNFNFSRGGYRNSTTERAAAAAEMVHQTYETVRRERVKAQEEAREKMKKEKLEALKQARRREHRAEKQKRRDKELEKKAKAAAQAKEAFDRLFSRTSTMAEDNTSPERFAAQVNVECKSIGTCQPNKRRSDSIPEEEVAENLGNIKEVQTHANNSEHINDMEVLVSDEISVEVQGFPGLCSNMSLPCKRNVPSESVGRHDSQNVSCFAKRSRVDGQGSTFW